MKHQDAVGGGLLAILGLAVALYAQRYDMGTMRRIGPGAFPTLAGLSLAVVGAAVFLIGLTKQTEATEKFRGLNLLVVTASVLFFTLVIKPLGVLVTVFLTSVLLSTVDRDISNRERVFASIFLSAAVTVVFSYLLGLNLPVWPAFLR